MPKIKVTVVDRQELLTVVPRKLVEAAQTVFCDDNRSVEVTVVLVNDVEIHELNRTYLQHDYATDVLSFVLAETARRLEAEIVVSTETAARSAEEFGWTVEHELLLYVIHGALHAAGFDDHNEQDLAAMRAAEQQCFCKLTGLDIAVPRLGQEQTLVSAGG